MQMHLSERTEGGSFNVTLLPLFQNSFHLLWVLPSFMLCDVTSSKAKTTQNPTERFYCNNTRKRRQNCIKMSRLICFFPHFVIPGIFFKDTMHKMRKRNDGVWRKIFILRWWWIKNYHAIFCNTHKSHFTFAHLALLPNHQSAWYWIFWRHTKSCMSTTDTKIPPWYFFPFLISTSQWTTISVVGRQAILWCF